MKRKLLSILMVWPALLFAQTQIISDNFDSYTAGNTVVSESTPLWDTWSGGGGTAEDPFITSAEFSSGPNSLNVYNSGAGAYLHDLILPFPTTYTTGTYEIKMKIKVPAGSGGYFNLGGAWATGGATYEYGVDVFFNGDGSGNVALASTGVFQYNLDAWNDVSVMVDLDAGNADISINGANVYTHVWGAASGFGAVDIFGFGYSDATNATEIGSNFFVDDVELTDFTGVGLNELNNAASFSVFPNPATTSATIEVSLDNDSEVAVRVLDMAGKEIANKNYGTLTSSSIINLNTNDYESGVYLVEVSVDGQKATKRLTIK